MSDQFQELREHRGDLKELFASKGWEIWWGWAQRRVQIKFEDAIRALTPEERENARVSGLALEEFTRLPFFLMEQAENVSADEAPTNP